LLTLGWTWKAVPGAAVLLATTSLHADATSSLAVRLSVPLRSNDSSAPSWDSAMVIFSSTLREMGCCAVGAAAVRVVVLGLRPAAHAGHAPAGVDARLGELALAVLDDLGHVRRLILGAIHLGLLDHVVELLLVRVHLQIGADRPQVDGLAVAPRRDHLVEREHQIKGLLAELLLGVSARDLGDDLAQKPQSLEVLHDVRRLVRDEEEEDRLHGLVHVPHGVRLDERVLLLPGAHQLRERRQ